MKKLVLFVTYYLLLSTDFSFSQVQWASKVVDFSSEYKDDVIRENSTRWSASQVLGYPNSTKYASSQLAWTPKSQDNSNEFITVGFATSQMVQQIIVGENSNAGAIAEIILYDNKGNKFSVYQNDNPKPTQKIYDVLTYFKIKPTYNIVKLKLMINTNAVFGRQEIDCIGISATTVPYKQTINAIKYTENAGLPENLGSNVNTQFYDHLPLISPDGSLLYFTRKLTDENNAKDFNDDIYFSQIMPSGKFTKAENIGSPLNTSENNFICFVSRDNKRLYVANKYIRNTYNYAGLSVTIKQKNGEWSKPKPLNIPDLYNKNEFAHYHMNMDENIVLMSIQRDDSYGDLDLYVSKKYNDGDWSVPINLGAVINTLGAEGSVFLAADGKTLYFSSSGHPGFGSYDMYMSKRLDESWTNWSMPLNLGAKINSEEMDIYYTIPASGDYAYFSSGNSYFGKNDLYKIKLPKEARPDFVDINKFIASAPLKKETFNPNILQQKVSSPKNANDFQTDEFQKKLDDLKKQQAQLSSPIIKDNTISGNTNATTTANPIVKKETLNTIQPYQSPLEQRPKPATINAIKPAELPRPLPKVFTSEELAAREQQKNNPTVNPYSDELNSVSKRTMSENTKPFTEPQIITNPNIITNEVDPSIISIPSSISSTPIVIPSLKTTDPKTDELQKKLDALKQQQSEVSQSNKIYSNPYDSKPYDLQPVKEKQADNSINDFEEYQKKIESLKQQQKNIPLTSNNNPINKNDSLVETPQIPSENLISEQKTVNNVPEIINQTTNPLIIKYEEKLRKIKEEMAALGSLSNAIEPIILPTINTTNKAQEQLPFVLLQPKKGESQNIGFTETEKLKTPTLDIEPVRENNKVIIIPQTQQFITSTSDLEAEKTKLDSIQKVQKDVEQKMLETLDKMGTSKQLLEKDITDLQDQRIKFNDERDKLTAQNSQLSSEKEKLDDLILKMQIERDKLAAEKLKIELDKAKLDLLKKQQERDVLTLKRSIDSLGKIQLKTANSVQLQQNYDLFNVPLKVGAVAQVNNIYFVADASFLQIPSYPELDKVVLFLARNNTLKVEIGGHTNGLCDDAYCQKLSKSRAKTCVDYLISKGIVSDRLSYKGYGKTQLLIPETPANSLNQRVEIKILSVE